MGIFSEQSNDIIAKYLVIQDLLNVLIIGEPIAPHQQLLLPLERNTWRFLTIHGLRCDFDSCFLFNFYEPMEVIFTIDPHMKAKYFNSS